MDEQVYKIESTDSGRAALLEPIELLRAVSFRQLSLAKLDAAQLKRLCALPRAVIDRYLKIYAVCKPCSPGPAFSPILPGPEKKK